MRQVIFTVGLAAALAAAHACGGAGSEEPSPTLRALATADAADGTVDHVVEKCAVCGLGMEGSAEHTTTLEGYELHMCSAHCKATFEHDPERILARLSDRAPAG